MAPLRRQLAAGRGSAEELRRAAANGELHRAQVRTGRQGRHIHRIHRMHACELYVVVEWQRQLSSSVVFLSPACLPALMPLHMKQQVLASDLDAALAATQPSVGAGQLQQYEDWAKEFAST